jgi:hypothetical protein
VSKRRRYEEERPPIVRRALDTRNAIAGALGDPQYVRTVVAKYVRDMNGSPDGTEELTEKWAASLRVGEVFAVSQGMFDIVALQLILRQELPTIGRWQVPRSEVPGLRRLNLSLDPVVVVDLRRRKYLEADVEDGHSGRKQRVRSIVRGHWHGSWVGPNHPLHPGGTEEKVLVHQWMLPYWRGPEGGPVKPRLDTVHVVRR